MGNLEQLGFYFYSAVAQSMAALFGLLGVFAIFKLQLIRERMKSTIEHAVRTIQNVDGLGSGIVLWGRKEICDHLNKELDLIGKADTTSLPIANLKKIRYRDFLSTFDGYMNEEKRMKKTLKEAFLYIGIVFVISLAFLFLNPALSHLSNFLCEGFVITLPLIAQTLFSIKRCILASIDFERHEL